MICDIERLPWCVRVVFQAAKSNVTALQVNAEGEVQYDAVLKQKMGSNSVMYSKYTDLVERNVRLFFLLLFLSHYVCFIHACALSTVSVLACSLPYAPAFIYVSLI